MGSRIACWSLSGGRAAVWRIHSTLILPKDTTVTALDCKSGNSIPFTTIVALLYGYLNIRIACHRNQSCVVGPYSQPRGRYSRVDSEMEESVCLFFVPSPAFAEVCVSVVPLSCVRFAPSLMYIATTALV